MGKKEFHLVFLTFKVNAVKEIGVSGFSRLFNSTLFKVDQIILRFTYQIINIGLVEVFRLVQRYCTYKLFDF
jgi:hypothetical protein